MKIHFCDLCNESVPQSDLDEGRAFLRKGRVICASCDRSMSNDPSPAGPFGKDLAAPGVGAGAATAGGRGPAPMPSMQGAAPPSAGSGGYPPTVFPTAVPRARGGAGVGLGWIALLFTGGLAFWVSGRIGTLDTEMRLSNQRLEDAQYDARLRFEQELERGSASARELGEGLRGELRELREWLDAEVSENQLRGREMQGQLDAFGARLEAMSESFGNVNRHDQELMRLQQRYTALSETLEGLGQRLEAQASRAVPPSAEPAASAPLGGPVGGGGPLGRVEAPAAPPWMGLVEQLSSPNTSERWQAVVALGEAHDPAASEFLVPALGDEDIFIRMVAARVLGDLGSPVAIPALIEALDDPESAVREAAYIALRAVTKRDLPFDPVTEDASDRARRIKAWRDWWDKEKGRLLEG